MAINGYMKQKQLSHDCPKSTDSGQLDQGMDRRHHISALHFKMLMWPIVNGIKYTYPTYMGSHVGVCEVIQDYVSSSCRAPILFILLLLLNFI